MYKVTVGSVRFSLAPWHPSRLNPDSIPVPTLLHNRALEHSTRYDAWPIFMDPILEQHYLTTLSAFPVSGMCIYFIFLFSFP